MFRDHAAEARALELDAADYPDERAQCLVEAAGEWQLARDPIAAERCYLAAIADGGEVVGGARAYYASWLVDCGELARADAVHAELWAAEPTDPVAYLTVAESLESVDDLNGAARWSTAGISRLYATDEITVPTVGGEPYLNQLLAVRARVRAASGQPRDDWDQVYAELWEIRNPGYSADILWTPEYDALMERRVRMIEREMALPPGSPLPLIVPYWPDSVFGEAVRRWPEAFPDDVRVTQAHSAHRRDVELRLRDKDPAARGTVLPVSVDDYAEYLAQTGIDPRSPVAVEEFAESAPDAALRSWPPGRNDPCWCGSNRKYKKCCGTPG